MDLSPFFASRTNWQEFEAWLDSLDFGPNHDNGHPADIVTSKGRYIFTIGPKLFGGQPIRNPIAEAVHQ